MKIMYVVPEGIDLGGIIYSSEYIVAGLKSLGHEVTFNLLRPFGKESLESRQNSNLRYTIGIGTGLPMNPLRGWRGTSFLGMNKMGFAKLVKQTQEVDLVVWGSLYGLKTKITEPTKEWINLFQAIKTPMFCFVRDDHMAGRASWIAELDPYVKAWLCVQPCSLQSVEHLTAPRFLVYSGHDVSQQTGGVYETRKRQICVVQSFKSWKNSELLVAAVPKINGKVILAGDGIIRRYMASKDKTKFFNSDGEAIWNVALRNGMEWHGVINDKERTALLNESLFLVDLSKRGPHGQINRIVVEAMLAGCVPICVSEFIEKAGFTPRRNFLPIGLQAVAEQINFYLDNITPDIYGKMQEVNRQLVSKFSHITSAQRIVDIYEQGSH